MNTAFDAKQHSYRDWYSGIFPELTGHGLWLRGGELNTLSPAQYDQRPFRVLFTRLSTYFDTGYSFTHQILYQIAAGTQGVFPDLAYLPPRADLARFAEGNVPWLLGTQTKFGPSAFDVIGFSNSIAQELLNIPSFLSKSGIPLSKKERLTRSDLPLILLGGANALYSSAIWGADPLVDGIFVGESDEAIRKILEIARDAKAQGFSKLQTLDRLVAEVAGFFLPEAPRSTRKSFIPNLNQSEALESGPVYYLEEQLGSSHLQISEGCPCFCSFCAESWDRKPYRERSSANLREVALRAKAAMGLERIDIYSFNFNMHSGLYEILWDLVPGFRGIGLKSQRFDLLAHDPQMMEFQHALEKASITCGLEGISPRLRKYLHKNLESEQLHKSLTAIFKSKARELKVFLIATGLEEEQDFVALDDFLDHLKEIKTATHANARIVVSMTPLVRFPWTPLEFEKGHSIEHMGRIIETAARRVRSAGFEFRESAELPEYWVSQVLVRAADPAITRALLRAIQDTGFVYYRQITEKFMLEFRRCLEAEGLTPEALFREFTLEESRTKPWAAIETGVKREFLWEEVQRARLFKEIDYCLGRSWTKAKCFHCGGCPTRFHVRDIVLSQQKRKYTLEQFKDRIREARESERRIAFNVNVGPASRGVPRGMLGVALARAIMLTEGALTLSYRGFGSSAVSTAEQAPEKACWTGGYDRIELLWKESGIELLRERMADADFLNKINALLGDWGTCHGVSEEAFQIADMLFEAENAFRPDNYLRDLGLKYTLRGIGEGKYRYEFAPPSLKKGHFRALEVEYLDSSRRSARVFVQCGPKFNPRDFVQKAFSFSKETQWVRVNVTVRHQFKGQEAVLTGTRPGMTPVQNSSLHTQ